MLSLPPTLSTLNGTSTTPAGLLTLHLYVWLPRGHCPRVSQAPQAYCAQAPASGISILVQGTALSPVSCSQKPWSSRIPPTCSLSLLTSHQHLPLYLKAPVQPTPLLPPACGPGAPTPTLPPSRAFRCYHCYL